MYLTTTQRNLIERVINAIETGRPEGQYGALSIAADGPNNIRQLSYGRAQATEYGPLRQLVQMYVSAGGQYSAELAAYADRVGSEALTWDANFKNLLKDAGRNDPVMQQVQDQFFEKIAFTPAMAWADDNGFTRPLSALVIYDSWIQSGRVLWLLRQRFSENPPALGGHEQTWISEYVRVRHEWLKSSARLAVRRSIYRTEAFKAQIAVANWDLGHVPVRVNGIDVLPL